MKRQEDEAYVVGVHPLGEADLIVTLLAREHGKIRAVASSARKSRRRFGGRLEPFTRARAVWSEREGRELHRLESLEGVRSFAEMQADPLRQAACAVLAEVSIAFAHEGQEEAVGFRLVGAVLEAMERGVTPVTLLRYFEYWTLRIHGLLPDLVCCATCSRTVSAEDPLRIDPERGIRCAACPPVPGTRELVLAPEDRRFLERIRRDPPDALADLATTSGSGDAVEKLLRGALENFAERRFRAYRHFHAVDRFPAAGDRD